MPGVRRSGGLLIQFHCQTTAEWCTAAFPWESRFSILSTNKPFESSLDCSPRGRVSGIVTIRPGPRSRNESDSMARSSCVPCPASPSTLSTPFHYASDSGVIFSNPPPSGPHQRPPTTVAVQRIAAPARGSNMGTPDIKACKNRFS